MSVEYLNFELTGTVFTEEKLLLQHLFKNLEKQRKRYIVIRETWLSQARLEELLRDKVFDAVVTCNMMDTPFLDFNFLNNFPVYNIGYYKNSPYYFDFHAYMVSKYLKIDSSVVCSNKKISVPFMSLNGKPYDHRIKLVEQLRTENLIEKNIVSLNPDQLYTDSHVNEHISYTVDDAKNQNIIPGPFDAYTLGNLSNWHSHFLNVVTETAFQTERIFFITEKTYKPILGYKPFIVYSENASINLLNKFGFKSYNNDFGDIFDLDLTNHENYISFLKILSNQDSRYLQKKYKQLSEKINYNREHFFKHLLTQYKNLIKFSGDKFLD